MVRNVIIAVLALGVLGAGYWGYQEQQQKEAVMIHAENNYQRAFHDLVYRVGYLKDKVGTSLGMSSSKQMTKALADVWKVSSEAQGDVGQLPLTLMPFNKTEEFLSNIGEFSYRTSVRNLDQNPLDEKELATLQNLYEKADEINTELKNVQHKVIHDKLKWMDVQMALASSKEPMDNTIVDGFKTVEDNSKKYNANTDFGTDVQRLNDHRNAKHTFSGQPISQKQAVQEMKRFFELSGPWDAKVSKNGGGADYDFYSVTLSNDNHTYSGDISKNGGVPIWLLNRRDVAETKLSLNEAAEKAASFLNAHGYKNVVLNESMQFDNVAMFTFVKTVGEDIRYLPASIRMKIALDNNDILGFDARQYIVENPSDASKLNTTPTLTQEEVTAQLTKALDVQQVTTVFIENDLGEDVLCYEILALKKDETYKIYINAENGDEEQVEKLESAEAVYTDEV